MANNPDHYIRGAIVGGNDEAASTPVVYASIGDAELQSLQRMWDELDRHGPIAQARMLQWLTDKSAKQRDWQS